MRDLFVTMVVFGSLPLILTRPYVGILMWSWIGYMNPAPAFLGVCHGFPLCPDHRPDDFIRDFFHAGRKAYPLDSGNRGASYFHSLDVCDNDICLLHPEPARDELIKVLKIELMTFVTLMLMKDRFRIDLLVWVIALSLGFYGVKGGIFTITSGGVIM